MKILHITTMDSPGAGGAAFQLHCVLRSLGVESKILVLHRTIPDSDAVQFTQSNAIIRKLCNRLYNKSISLEKLPYESTRPKGLDMFSTDRSIYNVSKHPLVREADIVNLHWVAGFIDYAKFFLKIKNNLKVVWTLHDENPFTGGCHVVGECKKYETGCGACPQLGSNSLNDLSRKIFKRKEKACKNKNIHIVTPSKWLADCTKRSRLFKDFSIDAIPNGVATDLFKKHDKKFSRNLLSLPHDITLILFGTAYHVERKSVKLLWEVLKILKGRIDPSKIALVTFGLQWDLDIFSKDTGFTIYQLGYIHDQTLLASLYSSCDMFVMNSLYENFPNVILESFSCGNPVIGVHSGGIPETVIPQRTGLLAEPKNAEDLAGQIEYMITHPKEREAMGENARKLVEQEYTLKIQGERYIELYQKMLKVRG
jgi:glycosyltransferase involved in cell wall biosynthesis